MNPPISTTENTSNDPANEHEEAGNTIGGPQIATKRKKSKHLN